MPILVRTSTYRWLSSLSIFTLEPLPCPAAPELSQVPFDIENYLRNGYLIAKLLRKFVQPYGEFYHDLLRVRKIATIKESENWQIIEPHLFRIGCRCLDRPEGDVQITEADIVEILQFLMDKYGPKQLKMRQLERGRKQNLDYNSFDEKKPCRQAQNSLQFICIVLANSLHLSLSEVMGLLIDNCKYLKRLMVDGSTKDDYESVGAFLMAIIDNWDFIAGRFGHETELSRILEGVSQGVLSESYTISDQTLALFSMIDCPQWFQQTGYLKLLRSPRVECFNFVVQKVRPAYQLIFNEHLHERVTQKAQLFFLFQNLIRTLPKTIYCRDILAQMPLSYFYEQAFSVMGPEEVDSQPIKVVIQGRELICALVSVFPQKVPSHFLPKILELFHYQGTRLYWDQYHILSQLFEVIEALMQKESNLTSYFFKIVMKYQQNSFGELRHWIIENLMTLYRKGSENFPLACFLKMYSTDPISQPDEFQMFSLITDDPTAMEEEEVETTLRLLTHYIENQLHAKCFVVLAEKLLKRYGKLAAKWGHHTYEKVMEKLQKMKIPVLDDGLTTLNPTPPNKNKVVQSIGIKRKEMLKFREFQLQKQMLYLLLNLKDKPFLNDYFYHVSGAFNRLQHQIGVKKKSLIELYKALKSRIKKEAESIKDGPSMDELVKSILLTKSMMQPVLKETPKNNQLGANLSSFTQWEPTQSGFTHTDYRPIIEEEQDQVENEFLLEVPHIGQQSTPSEQPLQPTVLLPFTDETGDELTPPYFYTSKSLEQHEIAFIQLSKQKHEATTQACRDYYLKISKQKIGMDEALVQLLIAMKLERTVKIWEAEQLFMKCRLGDTDQKEIMANFITQLAFHVFGFKKNRRVSVTCVESMFVYLKDLFPNNSPQQASENKGYSLNKSIQYSYSLSETIIPKRNGSYFTCFSVLSQILGRALGVNLMEPLSKQVNACLSPTKQPYAAEEEVSEAPEDEDISSQDKNYKKDAHFRLRRLQKTALKEEQGPKQEKQEGNQEKRVDNAALKQKIAERMKTLEQEIKSKKKEPSKSASQKSLDPPV